MKSCIHPLPLSLTLSGIDPPTVPIPSPHAHCQASTAERKNIPAAGPAHPFSKVSEYARSYPRRQFSTRSPAPTSLQGVSSCCQSSAPQARHLNILSPQTP